MELDVPILEPGDLVGQKQAAELLVRQFSPPSPWAKAAAAEHFVQGARQTLRELQNHHPHLFLHPQQDNCKP